MAAFAADANPYYVLGHSLWGPGWWFVVLGIINSAVGVGLACTSSASRVMYTMGREGTLPASFGQWIATLALLPGLFVTVYPEPAWPYNITP